jgi:hypothetical protein
MDQVVDLTEEKKLVLAERLELPHLSALASKASVSTISPRERETILSKRIRFV